MNERSDSDESVVRDEGSLPSGQSEHERRVAAVESEATGQPTTPTMGGTANRYTGSQGEPYDDEVTAEREGTTADEVQDEEAEPAGEAARWYTG